MPGTASGCAETPSAENDMPSMMSTTRLKNV